MSPTALNGLTGLINLMIILIVILFKIKGLSMPRLSANPQKPARSLPPLVEFTRAIPPVRRVPLALARRFFQVCITALAEALEGEDLTPLQYGVMAYVIGEPDIDQSGVAARLGIDRNNASLVVEQLEAKRLLTRRVNGADRRAKLLRLTPRGEKLHARVYPQAFGGQQRILSVLAPNEREMLLDLLARVIEGNRALARPGSGRRPRRAGRPSSAGFEE
ncbi:MAG: MarR family transcriptional regulator [Hyphomicrobiales bacterium]|nr:MarR family transcriptional regulator [Hyphomicrobiales bacterium]